MIAFIRGIIHSFDDEHVVIDNNGIGYYINFMHPEVLKLGNEITIYTFQHFREDATVLYGFASKDELDVFEQLISVKGMGPKTSLVLLANCKHDQLVSAIEAGRVDYLKSIPGIGAKTAQQIILDLKGKLVETSANKTNPYIDEAINGLKNLGYKTSEIDVVVKGLYKYNYNSSSQYLKEALKALQARRGK